MQEVLEYCMLLSTTMSFRNQVPSDKSTPFGSPESDSDSDASGSLETYRQGRYVRRGSLDSRSRSSTPGHRPTGAGAGAAPTFIAFQGTSDLLVHLSKRIVKILDDQDYRNPFLGCLSPHLQIFSDGHCKFGKEEVLKGHAEMVKAFPNLHTEVQNATATVDEDVGRASVLVTSRVSGCAFDTVRQSVCLFAWTRSIDKWSCSKITVQQAIEEFD